MTMYAIVLSNSTAAEGIRPAYPGSPSACRTPDRQSLRSTAGNDLPLLSNLISQRLCSLDPRYARLFGSLATGTPSACFKTSTPTPLRQHHQQQQGTASSVTTSSSSTPSTFADFVGRVVMYLSSAQNLLPLPIGECLVAGAVRNLALSTNPFYSSPPEIISPLPMGECSLGRCPYKVLQCLPTRWLSDSAWISTVFLVQIRQ